MLLRKFRSTGPDVIVMIVIITFLLWIRQFLNPDLPSSLNFDIEPMPLFRLLLDITVHSPFISVLLTFLMVLLAEFLLVNFNTSGFFISERTFLPALFFGLLSTVIPLHQILNPVLPAALFLILAIRKIMDSYKVQYTAYSFFDAGLLISTGSLFYANLIWFGLLLVIGFGLLRTGNIKEIIISFLGLITPWAITFGLYYVSGGDVSSLSSAIAYNLITGVEGVKFSGIDILLLLIPGIIILISIIDLNLVINIKKIKSRKTFRLLIWVLFIAAGLYILNPSVSEEIFWLAGIPASYFLSHYFVFARKKLIPEILFLMLFLISVLIQVI